MEVIPYLLFISFIIALILSFLLFRWLESKGNMINQNKVDDFVDTAKGFEKESNRKPKEPLDKGFRKRYYNDKNGERKSMFSGLSIFKRIVGLNKSE